MMVQQQLLFQDRVWYHGERLTDIAKKLFFYQITYTNVIELCQKYFIHGELYKMAERQFHRYISGIEHILDQYKTMEVNPKEIDKILGRPTFIKKEKIGSYPFETNQIYVIFKKEKSYAIIPVRKVETDGLIQIKDIHRRIIQKYKTKNVCSVRVVRHHHTKEINRIDFFGDFQMIKKYMKSNILWNHPYLYMDSIISYFKRRSITSEKKIAVNPLTITDIQNRDYILEYPKYDLRSFFHLIIDGTIHGMKRLSITLYRVGDNELLFQVFQFARSRGVEIYVNIELNAFGERKRNIRWARRLHEIGIFVRFHNVENGIKTHSKLCLMEFDSFSIAQIGTGNYNTTTSSQYCDMSYITTNPSIVHSVKLLFHQLIKNDNQLPKLSNKLLVTNNNFIEQFTHEFDREIAKGSRGYIRIKCNGVDDEYLDGKINEALRAGVRIDGIIRSGLQLNQGRWKNIHIKSIVWDKLEHARIYQFGRKNPKLYIGSLDLRSPKIANRIEVLVKIVDPSCRAYLIKYLDKQWNDMRHSWKQISNNEYQKL